MIESGARTRSCSPTRTPSIWRGATRPTVACSQRPISSCATASVSRWPRGWRGLEAQHNFVGTDFVPDAAAQPWADAGVRVFLFGAEPGVAERAACALERRAPNVHDRGYRAGIRRLRQGHAAGAGGATRRAPGGARQPAPGALDRRHQDELGVPLVDRGRRAVRLSRGSRAARAAVGAAPARRVALPPPRGTAATVAALRRGQSPLHVAGGPAAPKGAG